MNKTLILENILRHHRRVAGNNKKNIEKYLKYPAVCKALARTKISGNMADEFLNNLVTLLPDGFYVHPQHEYLSIFVLDGDIFQLCSRSVKSIITNYKYLLEVNMPPITKATDFEKWVESRKKAHPYTRIYTSEFRKAEQWIEQWKEKAEDKEKEDETDFLSVTVNSPAEQPVVKNG